MDELQFDDELRHLRSGEELTVEIDNISFRCCRYGIWFFVIVKLPVKEVDLASWLYHYGEMLNNNEQILSFRGNIYFCLLQRNADLTYAREAVLMYSKLY
ncbi:hypothetical protein ACRV61_002483 [Escherichia albertii]